MITFFLVKIDCWMQTTTAACYRAVPLFKASLVAGEGRYHERRSKPASHSSAPNQAGQQACNRLGGWLPLIQMKISNAGHIPAPIGGLILQVLNASAPFTITAEDMLFALRLHPDYQDLIAVQLAAAYRAFLPQPSIIRYPKAA